MSTSSNLPAWFVNRGGGEQTLGPFNWQQLAAFVTAGQLQPIHQVLDIRDGSNWQPATSVPGLFAAPPTPVDPPAAVIMAARSRQRLSPRVAYWLSVFIPGAGQIYADRWLRGFGCLLGVPALLVAAPFSAFLASILILSALGIHAPYVMHSEADQVLNRIVSLATFLAVMLGLAWGVKVWLSCGDDAANCAHEANHR